MNTQDLSDSGPKRRAVIAAASPAEIAETLGAICTASEPGAWVDSEHLEHLGKDIGEAHAGIDTAVGSWWASAPTLRRAEIASSFLAGYWQSAALAPSEDLVARLRQALAEAPPATPVANLVATALMRAWRRPELPAGLRAEVRSELLRALDATIATGKFVGYAGMLKSWLG